MTAIAAAVPASTTPSGAAGGDLSGTYPNPGVAKVNGVTVSGTAAAGLPLVATGAAAATWKPSSGQILVAVQYAPGTIGSPATSSSTMAAVDSTNVTTGAFTVPASGIVKVQAGFVWNNGTSGNTGAFALAAHGTVTPLLSNVITIVNNTQKVPALLEWLVTGQTPGASVNLDLMFSSPGSTAVTLYAIGQTTVTPASTPQGPVTLTVLAV